MKSTDGVPLQNVPTFGSAQLGNARREAYILGIWNPPTKSVGGGPWFLRATQCMSVLGRSGEERMERK